MGANTKIEWADHTANFWEGCTQVSPACDNCYAKARAERFGSVMWNGPPRKVEAGAKVVRAAQRIAVETGVKQFVFVNSLSDFFDNKALPAWRLDALQDFELAPDCIFLLLTKRIGNVVSMLHALGYPLMPKNVWLGITTPNQEEIDRDAPKLRAAKRQLGVRRTLLSIEPMLSAMRIRDHLSMGIDWVICGGESGPNARPMHPAWARSLRDQCADAGVPFFFKQWGEWAPGNDGPGGDLYDIDRTKLRSGMFTYNDDWCDGGPNPFRQTMDRIGKAQAGRLLDGVEHNGRPAP